jgi:uncharacterized protein with beta-barrel porin domain
VAFSQSSVGELVLSYVSMLRVIYWWSTVPALLVTGYLVTADRAFAACAPSSPVNNATITCTGPTFGQNGPTGYGTATDIGNIIVVQTGASVSGTSNGVRLQAGTVNNFGGIFGGASAAMPPGVGILGDNINVTNSGTVTGGANGSGITASALILDNSGSIFSGKFGVLANGTGIVTNTGTIGASGNGPGLSANTVMLTNSGLIFGTIGVNSNHAGNIFNSGTITGIGGTAISFMSAGNTLTLGPGSVINGTAHGFGNDVFQLGGNGAGSLDAGLFATQFSGYGIFNKIGASAWSLTGVNPAALPWTISGGTLSVNGAIPNSTITVASGGTLGGNGVVGATTINGGTLSPGNSIGLLTVQGNLIFTAASSYLVETSPTNADRTNVTGVATPGGAAVNAVFLPGAFVNRQYLILNASGGVSGVFNPVVTTNMKSIQATLTYDANDVFLNVRLVYPGLASGSLNVNQRNVANAITNFFDVTGSVPAGFAALNASGLTAASGELGTGVIQSSIKTDDLLLRLLLDPFIAGRAGPGAPPVSQNQSVAYSEDQRPASPGRAALNSVVQRPAAPSDRWSVWSAAYGGSATTQGNAVIGSQDLRASVYGVVGGADYKLSPNSLLGFALAGGSTSFALANGLGSGSSDVFQAATFSRTTFGPVYVSAALTYGWHDSTTNRTVALPDVESLRGRFQAESFSGRIESGYRFATGGMGLTPYVAAQAISFNLPGYSEQTAAGLGSFALNYGAETITDTRTEFGFRADQSFAMRNAVLGLRGQAAWVHDYNPDRAVTAVFQALPGASFVVNGARANPDSALVNASAELRWLSGLSMALSFESELSGNTTSMAGKGIFHYAW